MANVLSQRPSSGPDLVQILLGKKVPEQNFISSWGWTCKKDRNKAGMRNSRTLPLLRNDGSILSGLQCNVFASLVHFAPGLQRNALASLVHFAPGGCHHSVVE